MIEVKGNLWDYEADVVVITTNGFIKGNGNAVMGRGCAAEAANKYPELPKMLGKALSHFGNNVFWYNLDKDILVTFPVKHNWYDKADLELIEKSAYDLVHLADSHPQWEKILMPRPGCGNGQRDWKSEIKPILEKYLDDRFYVITYE